MSSPPLEGSPISKALAEAWQKSMPSDSDAEVARAYARFLARRAPRGLPARLVVLWLVTGMLLGVGTLYASGAVPGGLFRSPNRPSTSRVAPVPGRGATAPRPVTSEAESALATPAPASSALPGVTPHGLAPAAAMTESWERVAQGLRDSDLQASNEALLKLSRQGSAAEREVAKLVRAQVLMRQGRGDEAMALLLELSSGATLARTRSKAATLLEHLAPAASSHHSFEPGRDTNSP